MTPTKALHDKKLELKKGKLAVCSNVTCAFKPLSNGNVSFVVWWHNWARTFYIDNLSPSQALAILAALNGALEAYQEYFMTKLNNEERAELTRSGNHDRLKKAAANHQPTE